MVCDCLLSVSIMFLRWIMYSFLLLSYIPLVWIRYILLSHSLANGHLDCFHFSFHISNATMNICYKVLCELDSLYIRRSGIAGSYGNSVFNFLRNCQTFSQHVHHFTFSPAIYEGSNFSTYWLCNLGCEISLFCE